MEGRQVLMQGKDIHSEGEIMNGWRTDKPEKDGKYLVTIHYADSCFVRTMWYGTAFTIEEAEGNHWYDFGSDGIDLLYDDEVVAWQELPEPYRGGESNE